ncbi:MAG: hypothetical protein JXQ23_04935, partial [Clostridia bacterium]|nr:hypothetical protein [Clostridia bacterium]
QSLIKASYILSILALIMFFVSSDIKGVSYFIVSENIKNGSAKLYDDEWQNRLLILENPDQLIISFNEFSVKPTGLYFDDIEEDATNWKNNAMSHFYHKESIVLIKE